MTHKLRHVTKKDRHGQIDHYILYFDKLRLGVVQKRRYGGFAFTPENLVEDLSSVGWLDNAKTMRSLKEMVWESLPPEIREPDLDLSPELNQTRLMK